MLSKVILGSRYFKYDSKNELRVIKVVGYSNIETANVILIKGTSAVKRFKIPIDKLEEDYTLLNPDAYISFNIVGLQDNIEDIIVTINRLSDIAKGNNSPYAVTRQNIVNVHSTYIKAYENDHEIGMTLSIESCPEGFDFNIMTACNEIKKNITIAGYCDDNLEDILMCIKSKYIKDFNNVLYTLYTDHINSVPKEYRLEAMKSGRIHRGYCQTLKELLEYHEFMYDYERAFSIVKIPELNLTTMRISGDSINGFLINSTALDIIEKTYSKKILNPLVIRFDKDINLSLIKRNKLLIKDINNKVYIVMYTSEEELIYN